MNRRDLFRLALASPAAFLVGKYGAPIPSNPLASPPVFVFSVVDEMTTKLESLADEWVRRGWMEPDWRDRLPEIKVRYV